MLTPFQKKKIIRKIYGEQKRMLDEELEFSSDRELSDEEYQHLRFHSDKMRRLMAQLMPRQPLDWVSALVRFGLAIIIFILLISPPYAYIRNQYLEPQVATSTSATGAVVVTNYIAATMADLAPRLWNRTNADGPIPLMRSTDVQGMTAGIIPTELGTSPKVSVYYTEPLNNKRVLRKAATDEYFRPSETASSTVWDDQDFVSAVAVNAGSRSVVAAAYHRGTDTLVAMQALDTEGKILTSRIEVAMDKPNESAEDIQITPWNKDGWVMTSRIPRGPGSSLFDPTKIFLRFFDAQLHITTSTELNLSGYEIGSFPQLVPNPPGFAGYSVIASAHPLIRSQRELVGDEIFAFFFNEDRELVRMLRVTNNGLEHDFNTTGFTRGPQGNIIIGVQNIPRASIEDAANGYPFGSGRAYMRFFDQVYDIAGTVIMFDDTAAKGQPDTLGVSHLHQTYIGSRIYFAYDQLNNDNSETNKPERTVMGGWIQVTQR